MEGEARRRAAWATFPESVQRELVLGALDELYERIEEHAEADRLSFDKVAQQNRWILTLFVSLLLEVATALAIVIVTR